MKKGLFCFLFCFLGVAPMIFPAPPATTEITAQYTSCPPVIDGNLNEPIWQKVLPVTDFRQSSDSNQPANPQTSVRVLYDQKNVYFGIEVMNSSMSEITAKNKKGGVALEKEAWAIDAVEFYLSSSIPSDYYFFVVNVLGTRADLHFGGYEDDPYDWHGSWKAEVGWFADRWVIEAAIPFSDVSEAPAKPGDVWLTNLARTLSSTPINFSALNSKYTGFHYLGVKLIFAAPSQE